MNLVICDKIQGTLMIGGRTLNKSDLVSAVAEKADMSKKDAEKAVTHVFKVIEESLVANEKVQLVGFGTFEVNERQNV